MLLPNFMKKKMNLIAKKVALNKKIYKPFNLYINNEFINIKVYKIKNSKQLKYKVEGFKELQDKSVYMYLFNQKKFVNHLNAEIDLLVADQNFKIKKICCDFKKREIIENNENQYMFIWILKKGFVAYFNIHLNDTISTSEIYLSPKTF